MTERYGLAGMTAEIRTHYDLTMLSRAVPAFVHRQWGKMSPIPPRGGMLVNWRRLDTVAATTTALTEGTPPSATNVTVVSVTASIAQYGQFSYHSEVLQTQAIDPIINEMVEAYGETAGNSLDQVVRNVVVAGSTVQFVNTTTSRGDVGSADNITYAEIREAVSTLARNNAKTIVDGKYICIVHPDTSRDLFGDSDVITTFQNAGPRTGGNPMFTGEMGDFYRCRFIETSNARIFSSAGLSGADVYATMFLGAEYYGITELSAHTLRSYVKAPGSGGTQDPLDQFGTVGWKSSLAVARLNENYAVRLEHATSRSTAS